MAARDLLLIPVIVFAVALGLIILNMTTHTITDAMRNNSVVNSSNASVTAFNNTDRIVDNMGDRFVVAFFIGLTLAVIITGYFIGSHPVFIIFYFIAMVVGVVVSAILANTWETVTNMSVFGYAITQFSVANHLLLYMPYYVAAIGFIGAIAIYARTRVENGF